MASEQLYTLAYQYRKCKPNFWRQLYEIEYFAVQLPNGEVALCSVEGSIHPHPALLVYVGEKGISPLTRFLNQSKNLSPAQTQALFHSLYYLRCDFQNKDALTEEYLCTVRDFAKTHQVRLNGHFCYATFSSHQPNALPSLLTPAEDELLCYVLSAAIEISHQLNVPNLKEYKLQLGFHMCHDTKSVIPLLRPQADGGWQWGHYAFPSSTPEHHPTPLFQDELLLDKLSKLPKQYEWVCEIAPNIHYSLLNANALSYVPTTLMVLVKESNSILLPEGVYDYQAEHATLLKQLAELFEKTQYVPEKIVVADKKTFSLLQDICKKLGILLKYHKKLEDLELVEVLFYHEEDKFLRVQLATSILSEFTVDSLRTLQNESLSILADIDKKGFFTPELSQKLQTALKGATNISSVLTPQKDYIDSSLVIRVSIGSGCYRHIQISTDVTLTDLAEIILEVFEFENDHLYAFYMDNKLWSQKAAYYGHTQEVSMWEDSSQESTNDIKLGDFNFAPKAQFKFLFDFGDSWCFQCKVLRAVNEKMLDGETLYYDVLKTKGEPPKQYPDWDDEEE